MQPVTEASNDITQNIDVASPKEIVQLLCSCDVEIFDGWHGYPNIHSNEIIHTIGEIATAGVEILKDPSNNIIVLSGCGTSGRLAFILCRSFNKLLREQGMQECYEYVIAGGDKALFTSQEAPEDDPEAGIQALKQVSQGKRKVLFIGITCGLSAPFVAGQLDYCMDNLDKFTPVLLGFNPLNLARDLPIENWNKTFLQVTKRLEDLCQKHSDKCFILNPIVGPEAIRGSSRMKGGSVTKILLETIFTISHHIRDDKNQSLHIMVQSLLSAYRHVYEMTYSYMDDIAVMIQWAAESLNNNGHVYYIGVDSLATIGIIDASECPPTYSSSLEDIRGFIYGGYTTYKNKEGDISHHSINNFQENLIDQLACNDTVLFLLTYQDVCNENDSVTQLTKSILQYTKHIGAIYFTEPHNPSGNTDESTVLSYFKHVAMVTLPWHRIQETISPVFPTLSGTKLYEELRHFVGFLCEISLKWILNAISTGSHIMKGKIYKNLMIDVKVSNNKLYHRAISIIQKFAGCSLEEARCALIKSIYKTDTLTAEQGSAAISKHIDMATTMNKVVPAALLIAVRQCSVHEAIQILNDVKVVSKAILMSK
uniref:Glucokinase regulatory protein-like n=1 Tax=Saccoglossus kowalevskii TaxID=10224 RepID=A0ABM0MZZ1_SACKO|nr:PREDICTED: glucokinase regulatory protein-like [Saccoglossus kowalevskii]